MRAARPRKGTSPMDSVQHLREFKDILDRMRGDLAFEIIQAIRDENDPSAAARAVRRLFDSQDWTLCWEWRVLLRTLLD